MNNGMHAYEKISLHSMGILLGVFLILMHGIMLMKSQMCQDFLKKFPRNQKLGQLLIGVGLIWFWFLIAPQGKGFFKGLAMNMTDFEGTPFINILRMGMPVLIVLVAISIKEFLSVRALGLLGLLAAQPLLDSAFLKDPQSRLLIPIYTYMLIIASLYWVGMPYLFRDTVQWITAKQARWNFLAAAGLVYGIATLACAFLFWKGY